MPTYFFCANRYAKVLTDQQSTFKELAKSFSVPIIDFNKDATGIFPGHYSQPYRELQYISYHNLLALDIDSDADARKLLSVVTDTSHPLYKFNFIVYSTFSSTPSSLRLRLLIEVNTSIGSQITIDDYGAATRTAERMLDLTVDPASHKRNSFVYIPRIPPGGDYIFHVNFNGAPFDRSHVDQSFYKTTATPKDDFSEFVNGTSGTYNPEFIATETLAAMLAAIPPDCDYDTWIRVLSAMHHYSDGAVWGYDLVNEWSSHGAKYSGRDDLWYKWTSISDETDAPVTIGTIIHLANEHNWHTKSLDTIARRLRAEILDNKERFNEMSYVDAFCKRVSEHKFTKILRSELVHEIVAAVIEVKNIRIAEVKKEYRKHIDEHCRFGGVTEELTDDERRALIPRELQKYVFVTGMTPDVLLLDVTQPIDNERGVQLKTFQQFNVENRHLARVEGEDIATRLRDEHRAPYVNSVRFSPMSPSIFTVSEKRYANSYVRDESFAFRNIDLFTPYQRQLYDDIDAFMRYFIPSVKERTIYLNFLAYNLHHIGKKVLWAPVLVTSEGYGKDTVMALMEAAYGKHRRYYLKIEGENFFDTTWTARLEHRALIYVNEVYVQSGFGRDAAYKTYNGVKDLITGVDNLRISAKYQHDRTITQITNYSFSSNKRNCMVFPETERRLFVVFPEDRHESIKEFKIARQLVEPALKRIWQALHACGVQTGHIVNTTEGRIKQSAIREVLLAYFSLYAAQENWDEDFHPTGHAYKTKEFMEMARGSNAEFVPIVEEFLEDGEYPYITPYYCCTTHVEKDVLQQYSTKSIRIPFYRRNLDEYLTSMGYRDIKTLGHLNLVGDRPDVTNTLPGHHVGKTQLYLSQAGIEIYSRMPRLSITDLLKFLYEQYKKDLLKKDFQEAKPDQDHNDMLN